MKAPRLTKSKSNAGSSKLADSPSGDEVTAFTIKASFEDLRSPGSREVLRQQFSGAFPETHQTFSQTSIDTNAMGMKDRLSRSTSSQRVGQNDAALYSSSTIDSLGPKRLSAVRESNPKIDIEQAISLLQELKKSASPDELVALHKALLPTRDSIILSPSLPVNEEQSSGFSSASMIRHKSMLPAGLATRGGTSEDLLRKQEEVAAAKRLKKKSSLQHASSHSDLAALDLADDNVDPRAATPSDNGYSQFGLWRHGTLRITNGAASPEPSISGSTVKNLQFDDHEPLPEDPLDHRMLLNKKSNLDQRTSQDYCTAPSTPQGRGSQEFQLPSTGFHENPSDMVSEQERRARNKSMSGIPVPRDRDESQPRIYRVQRPRRSRDDFQATPQAREKSQTRASLSSDSSQSRIPLLVETKLSKSNLNTLASQVSRQSLKHLEQRVSAQSLSGVRPEIDDGRISPVGTELPRFAQRWSARASKFSSDNLAGSADTASPYEDRTTVRSYEDRMSLLKRLSTVYSTVCDGEVDDEDGTALGTPEAALSKLSSGIEQTTETPARVSNASRGDRPSQPQHADSGYGTDNSLQASQRKTSKEAGSASRVGLVADEGVSFDDDGKSLYTVDQVLRSPALLGGLITPSALPTTTNKKHSSFLKLSSSRRDSANTVVSPLSPGLGGVAMDLSSMEQKPAKLQKKLQKPMPASVRKERKEQMKKRKVGPEEKDIDVHEPSGVSSGAASIHPRFSFEQPNGLTALPSPEPGTKELPSDDQRVRTEFDDQPGLILANEAPVVARVPSARQRSKSRGRGKQRNSRAHNIVTDSEGEKTEALRSGDNVTLLSVDVAPKQAVFDIKQISCVGGLAGDAKKTLDDEVVPLWTDHASVSRSLGCGPHDVSSSLFKSTVSVPSAIMHQMQSPHQITTALPRNKSGGLIGMDSGMASELARMKSRDVAIKNNEKVYERPRIATPRSRSEERLKTQVTARVPATADDRFPGRENRSRSQTTASEPCELSARPLSTYSESIPPLPELPANVQVKVMTVGEMVAKRAKDNAQPTPTISRQDSEERPGDSTLTVAEAIKAASIRKTSENKQDEKSRKAARSRPSGSAEVRPISSLQVQSREIYNSSSEESLIAPPDNHAVERKGQDPAPPQNQQRPTPTGWEQQAQVWRERRRSLGQSRGKPVPLDGDAQSKAERSSPIEAPKTPGIVVSGHSTLSAGTHTTISTTTVTTATVREATDKPTYSASQRADAYRDLIGDIAGEALADDADDPSTYSVALEQDVQRSNAKVIVSQPSNARSGRMLGTPVVQNKRARSPGGRVITPSGHYYPYNPVDAAQAQRSRAESLSKLTGATAERSARALNVSQPSPVKPKSSFDTLHDRYSGGLQFNYERGAGVGGSSGTRARADTAGRKSKELSEGLGLDLRDIPFLLEKSSEAMITS